MWNLDLAFADVVATSTDPNLGAIRLAWWRERLEGLDQGKDPPAEPRLQMVAKELLPRGVAGAELAKLEDGWRPLLEPCPWGREQVDALRLRGRVLFGLGARLLNGERKSSEMAGELWSLADGAYHCSSQESRELTLAAARSLVTALPKASRPIRPLTTLAALAAQDALGRQASIWRGVAALVHRYTGAFPRS